MMSWREAVVSVVELDRCRDKEVYILDGQLDVVMVGIIEELRSLLMPVIQSAPLQS